MSTPPADSEDPQDPVEAFLNHPDTPPWLRDPVYRPSVEQHFLNMERVEMIRAFVGTTSLAQAMADYQEASARAGRARFLIKAWNMLRSLEREVNDLAGKLGLTPLSRFRIGQESGRRIVGEFLAQVDKDEPEDDGKDK